MLRAGRNFSGNAHAHGMGNAAQLGKKVFVAGAVDVIDGITEVAARIENLALDVNALVGENVIDGAENSGDVVVYVHQAMRAGLVVEMEMTNIRTLFPHCPSRIVLACWQIVRKLGN